MSVTCCQDQSLRQFYWIQFDVHLGQQMLVSAEKEEEKYHQKMSVNLVEEQT